MDRVKQIGSHLDPDHPKPWKTEGREKTVRRVWKFLTYNREKDYTTFLLDSMNIVDASSVEGKYWAQGGIIAALVDLAGSSAVIALTNHPFGVSVDISVAYSGQADEGDIVRVESVCHKAGKLLAFTTTWIYVGDRLIAKGK
ncbi:hypothetical protein BJ742DRAFT_899388 [Cladochytrium replicatum]|nr:hypothetical protein BJ742DRAFT_899388 [Cladochytrium replicatum]